MGAKNVNPGRSVKFFLSKTCCTRGAADIKVNHFHSSNTAPHMSSRIYLIHNHIKQNCIHGTGKTGRLCLVFCFLATINSIHASPDTKQDSNSASSTSRNSPAAEESPVAPNVVEVALNVNGPDNCVKYSLVCYSSGCIDPTNIANICCPF